MISLMKWMLTFHANNNKMKLYKVTTKFLDSENGISLIASHQYDLVFFTIYVTMYCNKHVYNKLYHLSVEDTITSMLETRSENVLM